MSARHSIPLVVAFIFHQPVALASCLSGLVTKAGSIPVLQCPYPNPILCAAKPPIVLYQLYPASVIRDLLAQGYSGDALTTYLSSQAASPQKLSGHTRFRCEAISIDVSPPFLCRDLDKNSDQFEVINLLQDGIPLPPEKNKFPRVAYRGESFGEPLSRYVCLSDGIGLQYQQYWFAPAKHLVNDASAGVSYDSFPGYYVLRIQLTSYPRSAFQQKKRKLGFSFDPASLGPIRQKLGF